MIDALKENIVRAFYVAEKDAKIYFFKWPNITFGLLLPAIIYLAFSIRRTDEIVLTMPGLVAMVALFGAGAIESVALPLERAKGTFERLLVAPISLTTILAGKALAGFFFGLVLSIGYALFILPLSGVAVANPLLFVFGVILSALSFAVLGVCISAPFGDIPEAMPPATLLRVAMVFLGGVFLPVAEMPKFLQFIARLFPLTYAVEILRQATTGQIIVQAVLVDTIVLILFSIFFFVAGVFIIKKTLR